ncbi:hypothetical protein [Rhodothermus marinus]|uniref:Uncharacterized protein n=1 Tax=Rhodothermus marinus (strain ATCC 43812 / DSM 4252 / R-10) TaxID=518766 RepID=D0MKQ8_RHOM4|nr:hypothetical protein [Rhodothermus marinus]ACY49722.1 hypothetical protein Rmar_2855 [Rhodothermus marinus DSM 4252]AEN74776.1 hypothetical protein Rhom172_2899 [Rhodothermus marinus SG0.5JP17-172]
MNEGDRILEAERQIRQLAEELDRLFRAANLLKSAQEQLDEVAQSSRRLVEETGKFITTAGDIVARLSEADLPRQIEAITQQVREAHERLLATLQEHVAALQSLEEEESGRLRERLENLERLQEDRFEQLRDLLGAIQKGQHEGVSALREAIQQNTTAIRSLMEEESGRLRETLKALQTRVTLVLATLGVIILLLLLLIFRAG